VDRRRVVGEEGERRNGRRTRSRSRKSSCIEKGKAERRLKGLNSNVKTGSSETKELMLNNLRRGKRRREGRLCPPRRRDHRPETQKSRGGSSLQRRGSRGKNAHNLRTKAEPVKNGWGKGERKSSNTRKRTLKVRTEKTHCRSITGAGHTEEREKGFGRHIPKRGVQQTTSIGLLRKKKVEEEKQGSGSSREERAHGGRDPPIRHGRFLKEIDLSWRNLSTMFEKEAEGKGPKKKEGAQQDKKGVTCFTARRKRGQKKGNTRIETNQRLLDARTTPQQKRVCSRR